MIRTAILILVLLIGCARYEPESQFIGEYPIIGRYLSLERVKADYPHVKLSSIGYHGGLASYLMRDGKILMAVYDDKKGVWNVVIRPPVPREVERYNRDQSEGVWTND